jgi:hypothetical protein
MFSAHRSCLVWAILSICSGACAGQKTPTETTPNANAGTARWAAFVADFTEAYLAAHPPYAVAMGRHEYDGRLGDWRPEAIAKDIAWLEQSRATALDFTDAVMPPEQRTQRDYLLSRVDDELFWLRDVRVQTSHPMFYISQLDPNTYVNVPYAPVEQRARAFIAYARNLPQALGQVRANLVLPLPRTFVDFAAVGFQGYADYFRSDVPRAFASVSDPELTRELTAAIEPAAAAMRELGKFFSGQTLFAEHGYVLGPDRFRAMLMQTERVSTPLEELDAIGRADLDRNTKTLEAACQKYLPNQSLAACVDKSNVDKPAGGAVEGAAAQLAELKQYVVAHDIASIPSSEEARVAEAPPYARQNFAYINIPGPYEKNLPSTYYIAPPDPRWSKAEQDAYVPGKADLLFTSIHEVWPGHFLQFLHSKRASWRFGQLFVSYAFSEGWAHYTEELMVEDGIAKNSPELAIGQVTNALLRDVRFLCSIGLHTQEMSVAQCEHLFKDKAYQDPGNARQQASRGTYDPAYLNYTMGKLMIRKLRTDWLAENPARTPREFHDQFLSHGGPPIPLVRTMMLRDSGGALF